MFLENEVSQSYYTDNNILPSSYSNIIKRKKLFAKYN